MVEIDGDHLTIEDVISIARKKESVRISKSGKDKVLASRTRLESIIEKNQPVYGINTGFGIFADKKIRAEDSARLSRNLILSHAVATGPDLPLEIVRAAMVVRANTFCKGYSGVREEVVQTLLEMLNRGVTPIIPSQGSLGSSGDLCLLSHLALVFTTDVNDLDEESGIADFQGEKLSGKEAMRAAGIPRLVLGPKEGLAVNNGATFSAAIAALAVADAEYLFGIADKALALSLEALLGCSNAFDARLHQARGQIGQIKSAEHIRQLIKGSTFIDASNRVQDAYSLRCAPQVHGASRDTLDFVRKIIEREINAATDNPLIFDNGDALSGGNFHGEPVGMVMDHLGIAAAEIGAISERRTYRLTDGKLNGGLPPMLVDNFEAAGLNSGLMMPQYTAASLVLENQSLATPDSVLSLPTSGGQEDHNANAATASRHARAIIENLTHILAVELYTAARAMDLRTKAMPGSRMGQGTEIVYRAIRSEVPYKAGDAWWNPEILKIASMLINKSIL